MKVILFGSTGMVGRGVLRECLQDPDVDSVLSIVRSADPGSHLKLRQLVHRDFLDFSAIEKDLAGYDACFYCLGISSVGLSEQEYTRITYDMTLAAAQCLVRLNPGMTFVFVSGAGTDSTEQGRTMWARVKGKAENALLRMPFKAAYMFRPAFIQPLHGISSKTRLYNAVYVIVKPIFPLLKRLFPKYVTTTELVGLAMLNVVRKGAPKRVLENDDINRLGNPGATAVLS